jgi:ATP-dependent DNA ligase
MATSQIANFVKVIKACQSAGGAGKKAAIQAALSTADEHTRSLVWHALNPYLTYGVRRWEKPTSFQKPGYAGVGQFLDLLQALSSRSLTGNAASEAVTKTLALYTEEEAEFLELVIEKDLKAGFSDATANQVWTIEPDYQPIPTFEVMLADKCESPEEFEEKVTFPCLAEHKLDGTRTIAIVRAGRPVEYRARSGKPSEHLNGLFDEDLLNIHAAVGFDFVMDGEAFASDFTETINAKKEGNDAAKQALRLRAFFMMSLTDWMAQKTTITMRQNRADLLKRLTLSGCSKVLGVEGREVTDYADMVAYCNEVIDVHKQEGLILKNWDATYIWDRDYAWTKVKRFYDVDARVVAWYKGRKKSRLENTCGGITVEGRDEHGRPFRTNVGSGFSDEQRRHIAENFDALYDGSTAVITYQEMSLAKGETTYALRFPTIKQLLRDDKVVPALEV